MLFALQLQVLQIAGNFSTDFQSFPSLFISRFQLSVPFIEQPLHAKGCAVCSLVTKQSAVPCERGDEEKPRYVGLAVSRVADLLGYSNSPPHTTQPRCPSSGCQQQPLSWRAGIPALGGAPRLAASSSRGLAPPRRAPGTRGSTGRLLCAGRAPAGAHGRFAEASLSSCSVGTAVGAALTSGIPITASCWGRVLSHVHSTPCQGRGRLCAAGCSFTPVQSWPRGCPQGGWGAVGSAPCSTVPTPQGSCRALRLPGHGQRDPTASPAHSPAAAPQTASSVFLTSLLLLPPWLPGG